MILNKIIGLFSNDLSIDLGTANTIVIVKGIGITFSRFSKRDEVTCFCVPCFWELEV